MSHHEVAYELLPQFICRSLAEDILFIGQTVIKFNNHDEDASKDWLADEDQLEFEMKRECALEIILQYVNQFKPILSNYYDVYEL